MELGIKDKTVLITASSMGIGKAVAEAFASEKCKVAICSRDRKNLIAAADEIKKRQGVEPFWCVCDLTRLKDIETTFNEVEKLYGGIDILVNNCGGPAAGVLNEMSEEKWGEAFQQVLMSAVRFSTLVMPKMLVKSWGRIINITSITVKQPIDNLILSNTFRAGILGFAKSLSNEVAKHNITINNIAPGFTLTHRTYDLAVHESKTTGRSHEEILSEMAKNIPMNRLAGPEEIAAGVLFLASQQASYITGNTIHIDGGWVKGIS